jgi:MerR family transcriptional regulator, redox-sensitive transcriptional activator SoxR
MHLFAQRIGMTLDEVSEELARLPSGRVPEGPDWAKLSGRWTSRIDERIALLNRLRTSLTACIGCGCLSLDRCQLANREIGRPVSGPALAIGLPTRDVQTEAG